MPRLPSRLTRGPTPGYWGFVLSGSSSVWHSPTCINSKKWLENTRQGQPMNIVESLLGRLPYVNRLNAELERLRLEFETTRQQLAESQGELNRYRTWVPPGHYLSPIPCLDEVRKKKAEIYAVPRT